MSFYESANDRLWGFGGDFWLVLVLLFWFCSLIDTIVVLIRGMDLILAG